MCTDEYDPTGLEELTVGEMGAHILLNPRCRQPWEERRCTEGISVEEGMNFYWRGLERLGGRGSSLIPVVSLCLKLDVNGSSCASWDL